VFEGLIDGNTLTLTLMSDSLKSDRLLILLQFLESKSVSI
jgi:hypothetical protein